MSYSKLFNIQSVKSSDRACGRVTSDRIEISHKGNVGVLEKMEYLNVRTTEEQIEDLKKKLDLGKISEEKFEESLARLQKIPEFVFGHVHAVIEGKYYPVGDILIRRSDSTKYLKFKCDQLVSIENGKRVKFNRDGFADVDKKHERLKKNKFKLDNGYMKQETHDRLLSNIEQEPDFILYRVDGKGEEI